MIKTRTGKIKYKESIQEIIELKSDRVVANQFDRYSGATSYKFQNCDFTNMDLRNLNFEHMVMDNCDFTGSDLRGATFTRCGLRSSIFHRCQLDGVKFINCNLREGFVTYSWAPEIEFLYCNLIQTDIQRLDASYGKFIGCDMRKVNARGTDFSYVTFSDNKMRGLISRGALFNWTNAPKLFTDETLDYEFHDADQIITAYKLAGADGKGIYHPKIKYEAGKEFDATLQDDQEMMPIDAKTNTGIAVASLTWVLKEWVSCGAYSDYRLFQAEFKVSDIIGSAGSGKFSIKKMYLTKEIDMAQFYDMMSEEIDVKPEVFT